MPKVIDADTYRTVMRHKTDAVAVVATSWQGQRAGLTATSVCSLSDAPPTVLACINRDSRAHDMICSARRFSVNFLTDQQQETAKVFSGSSLLRGDARFDNAHWEVTAQGVPILTGALAVLDCVLADQHDFSTHSIFLGTVIEASAQEACDPLIYFRGNFRGVD